MGWKSDKDGNHFNGDKRRRDVSDSPGTEVNIEIDNNSDDFSEGVKEEFNQNNKSILDEIKVTFDEIDSVKVESDGRLIGWATKYNAKVKYGGKQQSFEFTDSVHNTENGIEPNPKDVLYSLIMDISSPDDEEEFYSEFGYDADSRKAYDIYRAVQKEKQKVNKLFSESDIEKLQTVFQDY